MCVALFLFERKIKSLKAKYLAEEEADLTHQNSDSS